MVVGYEMMVVWYDKVGGSCVRVGQGGSGLIKRFGAKKRKTSVSICKLL